MNIYIAGALAGIVGGLVIAAVGMVYRASTGGGFWTLPNAIGGVALGPEAGATRALGVTTLTGVTLHVILSAIYGIATVLIARQLGSNYIVVGVVLGIALWAVNYVGIASVHAGSRGLAKLNPVGMAVGLHVIFGAVTGLAAASLVSK